ncbi:hypothetical protein V5740_03495 [Croceibacterium sp. TMG7-5b_MA50]|uniref:hypothetical protein n=1 Tax=Croceibacterium sp. TMG7-5b_MA50 TaxID=3121290 RepID=UPI0032215834
MTPRWLTCLVLLPLPFLTACNQEGRKEQTLAADAAAGIEVMTGEEVLARLITASVGPLEFDYDPEALTLIEMPVQFPIGPEQQAWGAKLLPAGRAEQLGQRKCVYGDPPRRRTCNARDEGGLVLSLLERPIDDYRRRFQQAGLGTAIVPARLDGVVGFAYYRDRLGRRSRYRFIPVGERTLMIGEQELPSAEKVAEQAIGRVVQSLAAALPGRG